MKLAGRPWRQPVALLGVDFLDDGRDLGDLVEADEGVDLVVEGSGEILGEPLGHAAGDDQLLLLAALGHAAVLVHLEDVADGFLLGGVDEGAGVDDDHVGLFGLRNDLHARLMKMPDHDLAIDEILGATERDETDFDHGGTIRDAGREGIKNRGAGPRFLKGRTGRRITSSWRWSRGAPACVSSRRCGVSF
jgi:hypothetical protein